MQNQLASSALVALVAALALAPVASADPTGALPPEPQCAAIYQPITSGPVAVTLVNGCTVDVEVTTGDDGCLERYVAYDLGTVRVESRDSCHYEARAGAAYPESPVDLVDIQCMPFYNEYDLAVVVVVVGGCGAYVRPGDAIALEEPRCFDVYNEWTAGPVKVVQRNSCTYEVYAFGQQVFPATVTSSGPGCMDIYREYHAGPVTVIQRSTCSYEVYLNGRPVGDGLLEPQQGGPEPQCLYVYRDTDYGVVRHQMVSSCESHVWVAGEQVF